MKYLGRIEHKKDLINKEFGDNNYLQKIYELPAPARSYIGKVYHYLGDTVEGQCVHGRIYECKESTTVPEMFEWVEVVTSAGNAIWGGITGTMSDQVDLDTAFNKKQNKVYFQDTEPTDAVEGDLWATEDELAACPYPINATLVQYTAYDNPNNLYPDTTWTDITPTMDGRYLQFDNTNPVATTKAEQLPNISGDLTMIAVLKSSGGSEPSVHTGALSSSQSYSPRSGTEMVSTGWWAEAMAKFRASNSNSVYTDGGKVQPLTYTVKLWQRTA